METKQKNLHQKTAMKSKSDEKQTFSCESKKNLESFVLALDDFTLVGLTQKLT